MKKELYPNLWAGAVQDLPLHPLPRRASERLVRQILGLEIPAPQITQLVEQSAGNPLFLEELIRAAKERKAGELPETVTAMIQARIGRLPTEVRRVLRATSIFGEMFWENGVRSLLAATHQDESVRGAVEVLVKEEIIEQVPEGRSAEQMLYRFRHALVRDAAYGLVNEEESRIWHATAGAYLESAGEREAFILATHYRLGHKLPRAIGWLVKAAEQAYEAGDMDAALTCVEQGLGCEAQGEDRGKLRSVQVSIQFWREDFSGVLSFGQEALALLSTGSKDWCRIFYGLFPAAILCQPSLLPGLMGQFLSIEPSPEARPLYIHAATMLSSSFWRPAKNRRLSSCAGGCGKSSNPCLRMTPTPGVIISLWRRPITA